MNKNQKKHIQDDFCKFMREQQIHNLGMQGFSAVKINNNRPVIITDPKGELHDIIRKHFSITSAVKPPIRQIEMMEKDRENYIHEAFFQTIQERRIQQGGLSIFMSILQGEK